METDEKNLIGTPKKREGDRPEYTWTIHYEKRGAGTAPGPALSYDDGSGIVAHEWPEEECSLDTIRERWGEGCYRVRWWGRSADGTRSQRGHGKVLELAPIGHVRIAAPAPVAAAPAVDPLAMYRAAQTDSLQGMAAIASLLQGLGGGNRGQSAEVAEERFSLFRRETLLAVQQQFDALTKANAAAIETMARELAETRKELAQLRDELAEWEDTEEDDDDDDAEPPRPRAPDFAGVVKENALDGLDGMMRNMGPAVMPVVAGYVGALQKKAEAEADAAAATAAAHREAQRQMQTAAPPAAASSDEAAQ